MALIYDATHEPARGRLTLTWSSHEDGNAESQTETPFEVPPVGRTVCEMALASPVRDGRYLLTAKASWAGEAFSPTLSRRHVTVTKSEKCE